MVKRTFTSDTALTDTFNLAVAGSGDAKDRVTVTVTPSDGALTGTAVTAAATVAGGPTISAIGMASLRGVMSWNAYDVDGVAACSLKVDGVLAHNLYGPYKTASGVNYSANFGALSAGTHTYKITAVDKHGNGTSVTGTLTS